MHVQVHNDLCYYENFHFDEYDWNSLQLFNKQMNKTEQPADLSVT